MRRGEGTLLVVGAHAFDAEVMAGALVADWVKRGGAATLLHVSNGEVGHRFLSQEEYSAQKRREARAAAEILGADVRFWNVPDTEVSATVEGCSRMAEEIRSVRPQWIITHWKGTWHPDHRATHELVMGGVFRAALPTLRTGHPAHQVEGILFAENWEDLEEFHATRVLDVSDGFDAWQQAINAYALAREKLADFPYEDYYIATMRRMGCLHGTTYAMACAELPLGAVVGLTQFKPGTTL